MEILGALVALMGVFGLIAAIVTLGSIWRGFVLSKLWAWFVVPVFGAPALGLVPAIALSLIVGFLVYQHTYAVDDRSQSQKVWAMVGVVGLLPAWCLFVGWVLTHFM